MGIHLAEAATAAMEYWETEVGKGASRACRSRRILARHTTHRRGSSRWLTATCSTKCSFSYQQISENTGDGGWNMIPVEI